MLFGQLRDGGRAEVDVRDGALVFRYAPLKQAVPAAST
jgi:hypothetical protein